MDVSMTETMMTGEEDVAVSVDEEDSVEEDKAEEDQVTVEEEDSEEEVDLEEAEEVDLVAGVDGAEEEGEEVAQGESRLSDMRETNDESLYPHQNRFFMLIQKQYQ